ncbi:TatD DNase [Binucleata daphniae]
MFFDISFNACDDMYFGIYNGTQKHEPDLEQALLRSKQYCVIPFFVGTNLESSKKCYKYAQQHNTYSYIGIHPNNATIDKDDLPHVIDFVLDKNVGEISATSTSNLRFFEFTIKKHAIAIGKCGLDYYRTHATKQEQKYIFKALLDLNQSRYFVHSRESHRDLVEILSDYNAKVVVHSFDGSIEEANELNKLGYYIGVNGHSTKNNISVIKELDINRIMIESDAPYCNIGKTYEGYEHVKTHFDETKKYDKNKIYKRRNEPCKTVQVAEIISAVKNMDLQNVEQIIQNNTLNFYDITKIE